MLVEEINLKEHSFFAKGKWWNEISNIEKIKVGDEVVVLRKGRKYYAKHIRASDAFTKEHDRRVELSELKKMLYELEVDKHNYNIDSHIRNIKTSLIASATNIVINTIKTDNPDELKDKIIDIAKKLLKEVYNEW